MSKYLVEREKMLPKKPEENLKLITVWSEISDNWTEADMNRVDLRHKERLERYRNRKDWEAWIEEDELDLEGERILAEIKNYKSEHFFNMSVV